MTRIAISAVALGLLVAPASARAKDKQSAPAGLWKPLLQKGAKWTLIQVVGDEQKVAAQMIVEVTEAHKVGDADIVTLDYSVVGAGKSAERTKPLTQG